MTTPNPQLAQALIVSVALTKRSALTNTEARRLLAAYGVACVPEIGVTHPQAALRAAARLGYPVRVAAEGAAIADVSFGRPLSDGDALQAAITDLASQVDLHDPMGRFLVQAAWPDAAHARVAVARDADEPEVHVAVGDASGSGPAAAFASGDAPLDALRPTGPWSELLSRIAQLALHFPELTRIELDPVYVDEARGAVAVGAAALTVELAD